MGLILVGILINIIPSKIVLFFDIPIFADSIGTILAAMLGGTLPAVIVGFFSNAFNGISDLTTLYYGIISILIGVAATQFQQRGYFRSALKACITVIAFAALGGILGSILTYFLYGYDFGEGISAPFSIAIHNNLGFSKFFAQLTADFVIDIIDKSIVVAIAIIAHRKIPLKLKHLYSHVFLFDPNLAEHMRQIGSYHIKRSLLRKVVFIVIIAEILLGALASITGFVLYRQVSIGKFVDIAHGLTEAASVAIDADRVDEFIAEG
ncbi:hypothetical protein B7994_11385 [Fibrobacter sp. UWR2]|nr:hypothetical protein B7994_11385 [Fibrobacter sp. UWR2]